jgi:uncharacterized damage-inducible protein DinB
MTPTMSPQISSPISPMLKSVIGEIEQEAVTTKRVLERVPSDKLGWKPHPKSMTIGQLAMHVATLPGGITNLAKVDVFEIDPAKFGPRQPESTQEILTALDASVQAAKEYLIEVSEASLTGPWKAKFHGREIMAMPRAGMLRALMLNHWYHHRGQLSVYLRLLEVPVPSIYGPSADENPFAD